MRLWILIALTLLPSVAAAEAGRLERARREVRGDSSSSSSNDDDDDDDRPRRRHRSHSTFDDDDERYQHRPSSGRRASLLLVPFGVLGSIAWIPWLLLDHVPGRRIWSNVSRFQPWPYHRGAPGHMTVCWPAREHTIVDEDDGATECGVDPVDGSPVPGEGQRVSARLTGEYMLALPDIHRAGFHVRLDTSARLGLQFRWHTMIEPLPGGDSDRFSMGELSVTFRLAQHERLEARVGIGWRYLHDDQAIDHGFNYMVAFDIFPVRPLILSVDLDLGSLGLAFVFQGRATVGAIVGPAELFAGYEVLLIGSVPFHGPTGGVRLWF